MEAAFDNKTNLLSANVRSSVDNSVLYNISTTHNLWGRTVTLVKDANPALGANSPIVGAIYWRERLFEVNGHRKSISDIKGKPPGFVAGGEPQQKSKSKRNRSRSKGRDEQRRKREHSRSRDAKRVDNSGKEKKSKTTSKVEKKKPEPEVKLNGSSAVAVVPGYSPCLSFTRRSSILFSQIGLGSWWRAVTCKTRYWRWSADRTEYEIVYHHEQWKALINLDDDESDERGSGAVTASNPARSPPHMRTRSVSANFGARDSVTINPGRNSGFSASTTINNNRHSRHSSARFSIGTTARLSMMSDQDEKRSHSSGEEKQEEVDPEKAKEDRRTSASLYIPYRNHLFHKTKPAVLKMRSEALFKDEVFLLLVLIYSETKRQDSTNSSGGW